MGASVVHALDGVDLSVHRGDYSAILGPSGSGKSTLMHIIGFMDQPTSGEIFLDENPVSGLGKNEQARLRATEIGFVFQSFNLLSRLSVLENVLLPVSYARRSPAEYRDRALATLERVGNLDSRNAANILRLFDELADEGNTILLVTHDESIAGHTRKIIRVMDGKISEEVRKR